MTKAQHDPHDLTQWLLSRDGDLARLAGQELERALDENERLRGGLKDIAALRVITASDMAVNILRGAGQ